MKATIANALRFMGAGASTVSREQSAVAPEPVSEPAPQV
jgi:hypothetical protein